MKTLRLILLFMFLTTGTTIGFAQCSPAFTYTYTSCSTVVFVNNSSGVLNSFWTIDTGSGQTTMTPSLLQYTFQVNGSYEVCLYSLDSSSYPCDTICQIVTISCPDTSILPPMISIIDVKTKSVITPNGDGVDDDTHIMLGGTIVDIYNRDGKLVRELQIDQPANPVITRAPAFWDGKDESGNIVPMGLYVAISRETRESFQITVIR